MGLRNAGGAIAKMIEDAFSEWRGLRIDQLPTQIPGTRVQPGAPGTPGVVDPADFLTDPTTTPGDIIVRGASSLERLAIGSTGQVPRVSGGTLAYDTLDAGDVGAVPTGRTITIDGTTYDLSANRTWTTSGGAGLPWFDVTAYGATGDGTTDDSSAVQDAVDAYNVAGGVLYFPGHGTYKTAGGYTLSKPGLVLGDGAAEPNAATWVSAVTCTSATAHLFTIAHDGVALRGLHLVNTAGSTPSAGSGIYVTTGDGLRVDACSFKGFYVNAEVLDGAESYYTDSFFYGPVLYGLRLRHADLPDGGDQGIVNCQFIAETHNADAAIRYESGGGLRLVNCKFNGRGSARFDYGLDRATAAGPATSITFICNSSFENYEGDGIRLVGPNWDMAMIANCQFGQYTNGSGAGIRIQQVNDVSIVGCHFRNDYSAPYAIVLHTVTRGRVAAMTNNGFGALLSQTSCTDVLNLDAGGDPALGGDLSGVASAATVTKIQSRAVSSGAPTTGDVLTWNGTSWAPAAPTGGGSGEVLLDGDGTVLVGDDDDWLYEG